MAATNNFLLQINLIIFFNHLSIKIIKLQNLLNRLINT